MSNVSGKAYAMNVVTPMKPRLTWVNRLIFMIVRALPSRLQGLLGLSLIHFARWVIIKRDQWPKRREAGTTSDGPENLDFDYMLFCSNFNGTWDQYIDAFSDGIPSGLNLLWFSSVGYPGSIPITPFKEYIVHNQIDSDYYYNATPGTAQRDVKCSLRVYEALLALEAQYDPASMDGFAEQYADAITKTQNCLGDPGYGPIASLDTERADENRRIFMTNMWGRGE